MGVTIPLLRPLLDSLLPRSRLVLFDPIILPHNSLLCNSLHPSHSRLLVLLSCFHSPARFLSSWLVDPLFVLISRSNPYHLHNRSRTIAFPYSLTLSSIPGLPPYFLHLLLILPPHPSRCSRSCSLPYSRTSIKTRLRMNNKFDFLRGTRRTNIQTLSRSSDIS